MTRYRFEEVKAALAKHWGLSLVRGSDQRASTGDHDGRWSVEYSRTGFVVGGQIPRKGYSFIRHETLAGVVKGWDLAGEIEKDRKAG